MTFKIYLRKEFGSLREYKKSFMNESGHFKYDWTKLLNYQKECYLRLKEIEKDSKHNYIMLDRLRNDCDYFLGHDNRHEKYLYYNNVEKHIIEMKKLYNNFHSKLKPEWITFAEIEEYNRKMTISL